MQTEYTGVTMIANHYIAIHNEVNCKTFLSEPKSDRTIAIAAAQTFAEAHKIPYHSSLLLLDRPIFSIIKSDDWWYPVQLNTHKVVIYRTSNAELMDGGKQKSTAIAQRLASHHNSDFLPDLGI